MAVFVCAIWGIGSALSRLRKINRRSFRVWSAARRGSGLSILQDAVSPRADRSLGVFARERRAVALASKRKIAALVLEAAFTSLADVAKHWVPFLPVQLVLRDRFRADQAIGSVTTPILMLHGGTDRDIPLELSKRLFESASAPKEFTLLDAGDLDKYGAVAIVRRFLGQQFNSPA